jgi:SNF2 family DNA or RNA helicase
VRYELLTEELENHIATLGDEDQSYWLILDDHPDFQGFWIVDCLFPHFQFEFEHVIGSYRALAPSRLEEFLNVAEDGGYHVAFATDPTSILDYYESLNAPPPFKIDGEGPNDGYYPWQIQGFNFLINPSNRCGIARWDTGTGKTVLCGMLTKWHLIQDDFDLGLVVVKKNNKIGTARKFKRLFDLDCHVLDGTREKRYDKYELLGELIENEPQIAITNYEKFREDEDDLKGLLHDTRTIIFWDEMPTKLRTRGTQLYDSVGRCVYKSWRTPMWHRKRPSELRQYESSAMPIERDPGDYFNCIRILDPDLIPMTVDEFEDEFVQGYNNLSKKPETWYSYKLPKLGLMTAHVTHDVSKDDPEVAKYFPKVIEENVLIDWDDKDRAVYDLLTGRAADLLETDFEIDSVLAMINLMQMFCNAPSMLNESSDNWQAYESDLEAFLEETGVFGKVPQRKGSEAATKLLKGLKRRLTDSRHTKIEQLRADLTENYPDEKALVFTTFNDLLLPKMSGWLDQWDVPHTVFRGTERERQDAIDRFESDPGIRAFLSSDAGSDGIDLPAASMVIHYDWPWLWARKVQRQNRAHRVVSKHEFVRFRSYMMPDSIEERKEELLMQRQGYHDGVFKGMVSERTMSARITQDDLMHMLLGTRAE